MLNRPSRFNAFNDDLYRALPLALKEAGDDWPRTKVTVLTGNTSSPWYSSGNDLTDFLARFKNATDTKQVRNSDYFPFSSLFFVYVLFLYKSYKFPQR